MNILTVDVSKINSEIVNYKSCNNKNPYIICSEETENLIASQCRVFGTKEAIEKFKKEGKISYYLGCKVLNDNNLGLGSIEVR